MKAQEKSVTNQNSVSLNDSLNNKLKSQTAQIAESGRTLTTRWFRSLGLSAAAFTIISSLSLPAQAYFSTIDTGELVAPGEYQASIEPQLLLSSYDGLNANSANIVGRFDTGLNESSSLRGIVGVGSVDFQLGGMYKYVPFPDLEKQPAIGFSTGVILARVNGQTEFSGRFHPLISKKLVTEIGDLIPYVSLPLGLTARSNQTVFTMQVAGGTEFRPLNIKNFSFFGELGVNLSQTFSYLSIAAVWHFDDSLFTRGGRKK
jgi:hypothetical protein